jgi:hypothetical protein
MKYFTPQLYQQFNSFNEEEAERADEVWDKAEVVYKERLATLREGMPAQVVTLSELCLHDAEVLSRVEETQPAGGPYFFEGHYPLRFPLWSAVAIVSVRVGQEVVSLIYCLSDHVITTPAPEDWRFSKQQEQWLYDEVDLLNDRRGPFVHRILFSTGITLEIPFVSVIVHKFTVPIVQKVAKQSA